MLRERVGLCSWLGAAEVEAALLDCGGSGSGGARDGAGLVNGAEQEGHIVWLFVCVWSWSCS